MISFLLYLKELIFQPELAIKIGIQIPSNVKLNEEIKSILKNIEDNVIELSIVNNILYYIFNVYFCYKINVFSCRNSMKLVKMVCKIVF